MEFVPANVAAVLQQMDQVGFSNLKRFYRRPALRRMILCVGRDEEYALDLLWAIHILAHSWEEASSATIQISNMLESCGFSKEVATNEESDAESAEAHAVVCLVTKSCGTGIVLMDDYKGIGDDGVTCNEGTLADILNEVEEGSGGENEEEIDNDDH
ncbi:hypothetical protein HPB48_017020 [Haemaphysalis longicornis]|uniref:DDE-1 domain-containing protein n=1 Tax=Haemaphysalis longicornis TaxID=44386 RepID=A0A9J6FMU0_HAELO|nr:hypothetical protein HPB48_017020 [Haemaphysalis longicornis]